MNGLLPVKQPHAMRNLMQRRIACLFVLLGILFGGIVASATAHANEHVVAHGSDISTFIDLVEDAAEHSGSNKKSGDMPCHAINHHHCNAALAVYGPAVPSRQAIRADRMLPAAPALSGRADGIHLRPPQS